MDAPVLILVGWVFQFGAMLMTPQEFAAKWRGVTLKERSAAQERFLDICHMMGHKTPADADSTGDFFTFEKGAEKFGGEHGFADVWYKDHFAWEYKTRHKNSADALKQLVEYQGNLNNPPLLVVCDFERFEIHTKFTNTPTHMYRWTNDEIVKPENLRVLRALFFDPDMLRPQKTLAQVTEEAAADFARLAPMLTARGIEPHEAAHFLIRALFCLFAEDIGLLPNDLFTRVVTNSLDKPTTFKARIEGLFSAMAEGEVFGADNLPYFNGGLFADSRGLALEKTEREILRLATKRNWSDIEPAIFGTVFERSLDPAKPSQLGAHYTSREEILRIVEPVVMAPLRARWEQAREKAEELREERDRVFARYSGIVFDSAATQARNRVTKALEDHFTRFLLELGQVTILDPACGSGNFLYVTLALLMDLQNEVRAYAADCGVASMLPTVTPQQLYGFEINPYARELAQVVIWIGYLQWMLAHFNAYDDSPILKSMETVAERDAVLDLTDPEHPKEPVWPAVYAIVGNPPFIGGKKMRSDLGDSYVNHLFRVWNGRVARESDFVCYWFEKARAMIADGKAQRVGLLATNSIRGGANRETLKRIKEAGDIFMAWSDEPWTLDGAAVRISLIGFDGGAETARVLDGKPVAATNADLTASVDLTRARRLNENLRIAFMGDTKGGAFDIPADVAQRILAAPINSNGRSNVDVIRPWVNGLDITRRPRGMFIIDFAVRMSMEHAALYEQPFAWVERHVNPQRLASRSTRIEWWLHERPRPEMRDALAPLTRYIGSARVAKHRLFAWLTPEAPPDSQVIVIARDDDYTFGVLHSRAHELWALRTETWLGVGNDPRYTPSTTFETFPFPCPTEAQSENIGAAARDLNAKRDAWLNPSGASETELRKRTLTNLYNEPPMWLRLAHERLDTAVFAAYGWSPDSDDGELLTRLLALNLEREAASQQVIANQKAA
jgi:hypothetical protein